MKSIIRYYFPEITDKQESCFLRLKELYPGWNARINVISRQDIDNLEVRHILFSLGIAKIFAFKPGTRIMDAGTGGGFPGIPLSIFFPEVQFTLVDSIAKKIRVVQEIVQELCLKNVTPVWSRGEDVPGTFDFVTGRAVAALPAFVKLMRKKIEPGSLHEFPNGILYLKGGEFDAELKLLHEHHTIYQLSSLFQDPFFETKKLVHIFEF